MNIPIKISNLEYILHSPLNQSLTFKNKLVESQRANTEQSQFSRKYSEFERISEQRKIIT